MTTIRKARSSDWSQIVSMLSAAALPTEDISPSRIDNFLLAEMDGGDKPAIVGLIGLQQVSGLGLVRSLLVAEFFRGQGVGAKLLERIEEEAKVLNIGELWLLTIDADGFFNAHGFSAADRSSAPQAIRRTEEFSRLCPGDAVLMRKNL